MAKKFFAGSLIIIGIMALLPMAVHAQDSFGRESSERQTTSPKVQSERRGFLFWRTDAKRKMCESRQKAITRSMDRVLERSQKQFDLFTAIADHVQTFYARRGKALPGYDALVAEVNSKKAAVQAIIDSQKSNNTGFKCDGENPRDIIKNFNNHLRERIKALEEYKKAVRNLLVGVRSMDVTGNNHTNRKGGN